MKENNIVGVKEYSISNDHRICLPKFCEPEIGDKLLILAMDQYIEVWKQEVFYEKLKTSMMEDFSKYIYKNNIVVGIKKRVNLSGELIEMYELGNRAIVEGVGDHIRIWNKEQFYFYLKQFDLVKNDFYLQDNILEKRKKIFNLHGGNTCLFVTNYLESSQVDKVVLILRKDFIEVWDNAKILQWKDEIMKACLESKTPEEKLLNTRKLDKILNILVQGRRIVYSHSKNGSKFIYLGNDVANKYLLSEEVVLEKKEDYFRIWHPSKYLIYQQELRKENNKKLLLKKIKERNLSKKSN